MSQAPRMPTDGHASTGDSGAAADARAPRGTVDRRRPTVARHRFAPDPRELRSLLAEVDAGLDSSDPLLRRRVRLLVGEIVARLLNSCPEAAIDLELEIKEDSVRIDIVENGGDCDFWEALDDAVFSDLTTGWGRDRRGGGGAWFEVAAPDARAERPVSASASSAPDKSRIPD